jgi:hypothetical protein
VPADYVAAAAMGQVPFGAEIVQGAQAFCPAGQRVITGGGVSISDEQLAATAPNETRTGWFVIGVDLTADGGEYVEAFALCAPTGQAVAASTRATGRTKARAELAAKVREVARQLEN